MSKVLVCYLLASLIGAAFTLPTKEKAKKIGPCQYKGIEIKEGKSISAPIGECSQITCINGTVAGKTCGLFQAVSGCKASEVDFTKSYPDCCPKNIC